MPSPLSLREQIAHAIREAQARYGVRQAGYGYRPHRDAAEAAAHAVLPLVEAAAAAERERVRSLGICPYGDAGCPCQDGDPCHYEGEDAIEPPPPVRGAFAEGQRYDERERLHTQLRDQRDRIAQALYEKGAGSIWLEWFPWDGSDQIPGDEGVKRRQDMRERADVMIDALLGVAATPQPCAADVTLRNDEHRVAKCQLEAGHPGAHDDRGGTTWTDATTFDLAATPQPEEPT